MNHRNNPIILIVLLAIVLFASTYALTNSHKNDNAGNKDNYACTEESSPVSIDTLEAVSTFSTKVDSILGAESRDDLLSVLWTDLGQQTNINDFWHKKEYNDKDFALIQALYEIADGIDGDQLAQRLYTLLKDRPQIGNSFVTSIEGLPCDRKYRTQYCIFLGLYSEFCWESLSKSDNITANDESVSYDCFCKVFPFIRMIAIPSDTISSWWGERVSLFSVAQQNVFGE